jgi:hypothetical protein
MMNDNHEDEEVKLQRKKFLAELNAIALYTAQVLHGDDVSKIRVRQFKKYFNRTLNMLNRIALLENEIKNTSFKYGYGGKLLVRKVMLDMGLIERNSTSSNAVTYSLMIPKQEINLELVSRIIVEVYLIRNDIQPL